MKKMKKAMSAILAAAMVMSMGMTAMAATTGTASTSDVAKNVNAITFTKTYTLTGNKTEGIYPDEDLKFEITANTSNPDTSKLIEIEKNNIHAVDDDVDIVTINLPTYEKVGKYYYTVKEAATDTTKKVNATQGVVYETESFDVEILAYWDSEHKNILTDCVLLVNGKKIDGITNTYDLGGLKVAKEVTGNLASTTEEFDITVTFKTEDGKYVENDIIYDADSDGTTAEATIPKGWTGTKSVNLKIKNGETVEFFDIPVGVEYTVVESDVHKATDSNGSDPSKGYTIKYDGNQDGKIVSNSIASTVITNEKKNEISTGISLDNMPYLMVLAMVALGLVGFVSKKRSNEF